MAGAKTVSRILMASGIFMMIIGAIGFFVTMMLNAFVLDDFDAYGEVPIPGSGQVQLPAGQAQISFHTSVTGSPSSGFPLPALRLNIVPPDGVADPVLTEDHSGVTTVNSDTHIRVWFAEIPAAGTYTVHTDGQVNGYINPRLAFGKDSGPAYLPWVFGAVFGLGLVDLIVSLVLAMRRRTTPSAPFVVEAPLEQFTATHQYTPSDQGVRLEQLKTLAALRDSGALTQDEFDSEKRRILGE